MLHLIRNTFRFAALQYWDAMAHQLRPAYTAANEADAKERLGEFFGVWAERYLAIRTLWDNAWSNFVPFLDYSVEIRRVISSTNVIESLHARMRRATRAREHFPNEQAAMKCLYLVVRSLDPTGRGAERWMNRWKPALNAFAVFDGRLPDGLRHGPLEANSGWAARADSTDATRDPKPSATACSRTVEN